MFKESFHIVGKGKPVSLEGIRAFCDNWDDKHRDVRRVEKRPVYPRGEKRCTTKRKQI